MTEPVPVDGESGAFIVKSSEGTKVLSLGSAAVIAVMSFAATAS